MIDFSKAPEGATLSDRALNDAGWVMAGELQKYLKLDSTSLKSIKPCLKIAIDRYILACNEGSNQTLTVTCDNERQKMLCEQVIRMDRGEESEYRILGRWTDHKFEYIVLNGEYRAKPKKELVVPWDILADEVKEIRVDSNGCIYDGNTPLRIKLDLDGISLPVTVNRPEVK